MSWKDCVDGIKLATGRDLTDDEVERIVTAAQVRLTRKLASGLGAKLAAQQATEELVGEALVEAMKMRRTKLLTLQAQQRLEARTIDGREYDSLIATLNGVQTGTDRELGRSVGAMRHGNVALIVGDLVAKLRQEGLLAVFRSKDRAMNLDITRELWEAGSTKNATAARVAVLVGEANERARNLLNSVGEWIPKINHYVSAQTHDTLKIRQAGFQEWRDFILPRLGAETFDKTDGTPEGVNRYLRDVWNSFQTMIHDPGSKGRSLMFKDADSWFEYNEKFGKGNVSETTAAMADSAARDAALMETFGPDWETGYKDYAKSLAQRAKDREDGAEAAKFQGLKAWHADQMLYVASGQSAIPGNTTAAHIGSAVRSLMQLRSLGGVLLSSVPDIITSAATLRHNGVPLLQAIGNQAAGLLPYGQGRRQVADLMGAGIDSMLSDVVHRFRADDGLHGSMSKAVGFFHKINGLSYWTDAQKKAMGDMLSRNLAMLSNREFGALPSRLQATFRRYGIEADEWNAGRATVQRTADGRRYLLPADMQDKALSRKFQTYISDQIAEGMNEPTVRARSIATFGGANPGTWSGEIARYLMQFKSFTLTFMERQWGREFRRDGVDWGGAIGLTVGLTIMGYLAYTFKEIAAGRTPAQPQDAKGIAEEFGKAFVQGGAGGMFADLLVRERNLMTGGVAGSLAGPTVSTLDHLIGDLQSLFKENKRKTTGQVAGAAGLDAARQLTPGINLFYLKAALDYAFLYRLQEAVNPGYIARYEKRVRDAGQDFWIMRPSDAAR